MPFVDSKTKSIILLYKRCRDRQALPEAGSLLDQPEWILEAFDVIDAEISQCRKQEADEMRRKAISDEALRKLGHGRDC